MAKVKKINATTAWHEAYSMLAKALADFYLINKNESGKILFELCSKNTEFTEDNIWALKFSDTWQVHSLDPIHVFASISNYKTTSEKRTRIINNYFKIILNTNKILFKEIDYVGCPSPVFIRIIGARDVETQIAIWGTFNRIYSAKPNNVEKDIFTRIKKWYGIDISSFTIFLFWIDSSKYLPLDKNTISFLIQNKKILHIPKNYSEYLKLLVEPETSLYRNVTKVAYNSNELVNLSSNEKKELDRYLNTVLASPDGAKSGVDFRLIAIKLLKDADDKYKNSIEKERLYHFTKSFEIDEKANKIAYKKEMDFGLYSTTNLNISIGAIVGKNGSGKSTIIELLFSVINNIAYSRITKTGKKKDLKYAENLHAELYIKTNFVYKISIRGKEIEIIQYSTPDGYEYTSQETLTIEQFNIENWFYTIGVNYSLYGLNESEIDEWIKPLFHKNDAYQTPIVLEPFRKEGNIDVNVQNQLANSRLLANLLEQELPNEENSFRQLTKNLKAEELEFELDQEKISYLYKRENDKSEKIPFSKLKGREKVLKELYEIFMQNPDSNWEPIFRKEAERYLLKKLVSISRTYQHYRRYFIESKNEFSSLTIYLQKLYKDRSHITHKLRQTINYLGKNIFDYNKTISIEDLSNRIEFVKKSSNSAGIFLETIELIPPPFLKTTIRLTNGIPFKKLSSGEKQRIYGINSILYHLKNINSVKFSNNGLLNYQSVAIILDEIELYFHPEMQRTYLSYLLDNIKKLELDSISGISLEIVTHSPFILSDISSNNILFLSEDNRQVPKDDFRTFGANIHELLISGFFMENTIGGFAQQEIKGIIDFYTKVSNAESKKDLSELKENYILLGPKFETIIENLGENYIKTILSDHMDEIQRILGVEESPKEKIDKLQQEIDRLKIKHNVKD